MSKEDTGKRTNGVAEGAPVEVARSTRKFRQRGSVNKNEEEPAQKTEESAAFDVGLSDSIAVINIAQIPSSSGGQRSFAEIQHSIAQRVARDFVIPRTTPTRHPINGATVAIAEQPGDATTLGAVRRHVGNEFGRRVPVDDIIPMSIEPGVWFYIVQWRAGDLYHALAVSVSSSYTETLGHRTSPSESAALGSLVLHRASML